MIRTSDGRDLRLGVAALLDTTPDRIDRCVRLVAGSSAGIQGWLPWRGSSRALVRCASRWILVERTELGYLRPELVADVDAADVTDLRHGLYADRLVLAGQPHWAYWSARRGLAELLAGTSTSSER